MARPSHAVLLERRSHMALGLRRCIRCREIKSLGGFPSNRSNMGSRGTACLPCHNEAGRQRYHERKGSDLEAFRRSQSEANKRFRERQKVERPEDYRRTNRRHSLKRLYGMTESDFDRMLADQDGRCAICMTVNPQRRWHVDHDHDTGEVRGILCNLCNVGLGAFKDNPEALSFAAFYLQCSVAGSRSPLDPAAEPGERNNTWL